MYVCMYVCTCMFVYVCMHVFLWVGEGGSLNCFSDADVSSLLQRLFPPFVIQSQGGFAKCYEMIDLDDKKIYAGKIVSKATLDRHRAKEKVSLDKKKKKRGGAKNERME